MVTVIPQMSYDKKCDGSFVKVNSKIIIEKARASLANIEKRKKRETQRLVDDRRKELVEREKKRENSWWSRLFGYKARQLPTDEQILHSIENERGDGIWLPETFWIDYRYSKNQDIAYRLINAAEYAEEIYVSTEDLERLL